MFCNWRFRSFVQYMSALIAWVPAQYYCPEFLSLSLGGSYYYYYYKSQYLSLDVSLQPWDTVMAGTNTLITIRGRNYCLELQYLVVSTLSRNSVPVTRCQNTFQSPSTCHKLSTLLSSLPVATIRVWVAVPVTGCKYTALDLSTCH